MKHLQQHLLQTWFDVASSFGGILNEIGAQVAGEPIETVCGVPLISFIMSHC